MRMPGRFGSYGGCYVPEILVPALEQLETAWLESMQDPSFGSDLADLLEHYAGRPTPLYRCRNLVPGPGRLYLKREDLLHGGAHKTNQALAQGLLAKRMGKRLLIAETGAGQHGVATALTGAVLGIPVRIYMGASDIARQRANVLRMRLMGAEVVQVTAGSATLKEAINEALRAWSGEYERAHYLLGTAAGPHPFPSMVRDFQRVIGDEARAQFLSAEGALPDVVIACVGGGSNALGIFTAFLGDGEVRLVGVEAGGDGSGAGRNQAARDGATLARGRPGSLHGAWTMVLQDSEGQIDDSQSIAAGLDYPAVGPEHVHLMESGRATYTTCTDSQALGAFQALARAEGILPALESAHAVAEALRQAPTARRILVNLSGRGDKDLDTVAALPAGRGSAT